ncbi:MAG: GntR family transcriptional regulator [Alphaproteobacteria bacterium]
MIDEEHWKPGDQLPAEANMARILEVSLGTIQKTLGLLAERGVIIREHGRGTFVTGGEAPQQDLWYFRFLGDDGVSLLPIYSRVLDVDVVTEDGPWATFLGDTQSFVRIRRLMSVDHEFDVYSEVYFSAERFGAVAGYSIKNLHGAIVYRVLDEKFNAPTLRVAQKIMCAPLPSKICLELAIESGATGLIWEIFSYAAHNAPLIYQRAFVPPNNRALYVSDMVLSRNHAMASSLATPMSAG